MSNKALMTAMLEVQKQAPGLALGKDAQGQVGSHKYKYLTLDKLMDRVMPVLSEQGLVWMTFPTFHESGDPALGYRLTHAESGESLEGTMPLMLAKSDPQGLGSALTYCRRYSMLAVLGIVADEDDDASVASQPKAAKASNGNGKPSELLDSDALALLIEHIREHKATEKIPLMLSAVGAADIEGLTREQGHAMWKMAAA